MIFWALTFHSLQSQVTDFFSHRQTYLPLYLTLTQKSLSLSDCSSMMRFEANQGPVSQFKEVVLFFLQSYSMQAAEEMLKQLRRQLMLVSWALRAVNFKTFVLRLLILSSKSSRTRLITLVLYALAISKLILNMSYQVDKCRMFQQSASDKLAGIGFPRYLSTIKASCNPVIDDRLTVVKLNRSAIFFMKGQQVAFISLYTESCMFQFLSASAVNLGHDPRSTLVFMVTGTGWQPFGRANYCSEESVSQEQGGRWYFLSTVGNLGPFPSGYMAQS